MTARQILSVWCMLVSCSGFQFPFLSKQNAKAADPKELLSTLESLIAQSPKNGIDTSPALERDIQGVCEDLERSNPTRAPVRNTELMKGLWSMRWTNFSPAAPSSGQLGPFVGDVYQDINFDTGIARNILSLDFPPIRGELTADIGVVDASTLSITFKNVGNKLAGFIPVGPKVEFEPGKEVRLWEHVYLDDDYRILYARRQEEKEDRGFIYVMKRASDELSA